MHRERTWKILCLTLACCMAAPSVSHWSQRTPETQTPADAKQQVLDLENEWVAAEHNHDTATLAAYSR